MDKIIFAPYIIIYANDYTNAAIYVICRKWRII